MPRLGHLSGICRKIGLFSTYPRNVFVFPNICPAPKTRHYSSMGSDLRRQLRLPQTSRRSKRSDSESNPPALQLRQRLVRADRLSEHRLAFKLGPSTALTEDH